LEPPGAQLKGNSYGHWKLRANAPAILALTGMPGG